MTAGTKIGLLTVGSGPTVLDLAVAHGLDFVWLDAEYTALAVSDCYDMVRALTGTKVRSIVRVPNLDPDVLITFANSGVEEIVLPRVRSVDEVARASEALSYPPEGSRPRGVGPASAYGARWEASPSLSVLVETRDAVDALEELCDLDGVDGFWLGPKDLEDDYRSGLGESGWDLGEVLEGIATQLSSRGRGWGVGATNLQALRKAISDGVERCAIYWEPFVSSCLADALRDARTPSE